MLRRIAEKRLQDTVRSAEIRRICRVEDINIWIKHRKTEWTQERRMPEQRIAKDKSPAGRRKRWNDNFRVVWNHHYGNQVELSKKEKAEVLWSSSLPTPRWSTSKFLPSVSWSCPICYAWSQIKSQADFIPNSNRAIELKNCAFELIHILTRLYQISQESEIFEMAEKPLLYSQCLKKFENIHPLYGH